MQWWEPYKHQLRYKKMVRDDRKRVKALIIEEEQLHKIYKRFVNLDGTPANIELREYNLAQQIKKDMNNEDKITELVNEVLDGWERQVDIVCGKSKECVEEYMCKPKRVSIAEEWLNESTRTP